MTFSQKEFEEGLGRPNTDPMTPEEIETFKGVLERVGQRKSQGFVWMAEILDGTKDSMPANGIIFSNDVSKHNMIFNLWYSLGLTHEQQVKILLELAAQVKGELKD